jgi:PST family polysaccharide transporter
VLQRRGFVSMSSVKKGMLAGALSLGLAGMLAKVLGVAYQVPFQNWAGNYTVSLYQLSYSIYIIMLYVATSGIPLAMSKLIAEANAKEDFAGADALYRVGVRYLTLTGVVTFGLMFFGGGWLAAAMGNAEATLAMQALSFALLIVPPMAAMRGYMQGHHMMTVSGNSQVIEQLVRSTFILVGVYACVRWGMDRPFTAAVATFSALAGAAASTCFLLLRVMRLRRENRKKFEIESLEPQGAIFKRIAKVAVPLTLTSLVLPLSQLVDSLTVINLIKWGMGWTTQQASDAFGIFTGQALKLVALPLALATAVGLSLMPSITEAIALKDRRLTQERVRTALRLTSFFAFPTAAGILVLARAIEVTLFAEDTAVATIALVSLMSIFSSYELVTTYILQAMGHMYQPVRHMFFGLFVKFVLNLLLVPLFGIFGAGLASVVGYLCSSALNFYRLKKRAEVALSLREMLTKPLAAAVLTGLVLFGLDSLPWEAWIPWVRVANLALVLVGGCVGAVVFFGAMVLMRGISQEEMRRMPVVKRFVRREVQG